MNFDDLTVEEVQAATTPAQWERILGNARKKHDADFLVDTPPPERVERSRQGAERILNVTWLAWLVIAIAGAIISFPHTWEIVRDTVDLSGKGATAYAAVVFVGLELSILAIAFMMTLNHEIGERPERRQWSLAGIINWVARRIGIGWQIDLSHLPRVTETTSQRLIMFLFLVQVIFNVSDPLRTVPMVAGYTHIIELIVKLAVGFMAPVLLWVAGHRTAEEVASAINLARADDSRLLEWKNERESSWQTNRDEYVLMEASRSKTVVKAVGRNVPGTPFQHGTGTPAMASERGMGFSAIRSTPPVSSVPVGKVEHRSSGTPDHDDMIAEMLDNPDMIDWSHQQLADYFGIRKGRATTALKNDPRLGGE